MSADDWVWACIAGAVAILLLTPAAFDIWHKRRTRRRFQASAKEAARHTEADVAEDVATTKAIRQDEQAAKDLAELYKIWPDPPRGKSQIPHQTRKAPRTEEDQ